MRERSLHRYSRHKPSPRCPSLLFTFFYLSLSCLTVIATPASLPFSECSAGNAIDPSLKINASEVYGQIVTTSELGRHLNLTVIGNTGQAIEPISNDTDLLATLFTTSSILSISVSSNSSFFCSSAVPASPLPTENSNSTYFYCPISAGPVAFSASIPFGDHDYHLLTLSTRLRVVDTSSPAKELLCIDVSTTPLTGKEMGGSIYGVAVVIFWVSVALCIAYWAMSGVARLTAAWGRRGSGSGRNAWDRLKGAGYMLASAVSGERFAGTPALLRFCTPSLRDIFFHTQYCALMGMVAVQWPTFAYPLFAQTAWSTLLYNITLAQDGNATTTHWYPLRVQDYNPSSDFADQLSNSSSPIFVDADVPNSLFMFPDGTNAGIESFAAAVGLRPQDLFGVCLILFLCIVAVVILLSEIIWGLDRLGSLLFGTKDKAAPFGVRTPAYSTASKELDKLSGSPADDQGASIGHYLFRTASIPLSGTLNRKWWRIKLRPGSFHRQILHGNLVRILILFHLPITLFSAYQFSNAGQSSVISVVLAVLSFVVISVGIPIFLVFRLYTTATNKLYDETRTLMMLGPLYNHFGHGSQLFACILFANNIIYGVTVGCGQKSGTAQAIIILVAEIGSSLSTSIWLPWGRGATMGLISFLFCVARITIGVLLVILTPTVSVGISAGAWVAAAILVILGLMYVAFALILGIKLLEAVLRIIGKIPFDRSKHHLDSGFLGVLGLLGCCSPRRRNRRRNGRPAMENRSSSHLGSAQPFILGNANRTATPPGSTSGPPSVLRPEQAFRPYREDTDDESGYIMGSFQNFHNGGYEAVNNRPVSPPSEILDSPPKSGFSRVGGGRARFDSPYSAITSTPPSGLKHEFPRSDGESSIMADSERSRSTVTVNRATVRHPVGGSNLPPGAMASSQPRVHVRTKSQTAIIEDASQFFKSEDGSAAAIFNASDLARPPPVMNADTTDDSSIDALPPKRTIWNKFRKIRRMSEGSMPVDDGADDVGDDGGRAGGSAGNSGGKSFVVLRDKKSMGAPAGEIAAPKAEEPPEEGRRSFVVLRNNNASSSTTPKTRRMSHA